MRELREGTGGPEMSKAGQLVMDALTVLGILAMIFGFIWSASFYEEAVRLWLVG